jgi:rRNA maturation RNase YbeY
MKGHRAHKTTRVKIFNPAGYRAVDTRRIRTLIRHILRSEQKVLQDLHVIIVDDAYMTRLNNEFFSRKGPTNVIAFDLDDISEIYVSSDQVRDKDDLYYYVAHGLMHLIGYVHDNARQTKSMNAACANYVQEVRGTTSTRNQKSGTQ